MGFLTGLFDWWRERERETTPLQDFFTQHGRPATVVQDPEGVTGLIYREPWITYIGLIGEDGHEIRAAGYHRQQFRRQWRETFEWTALETWPTVAGYAYYGSVDGERLPGTGRRSIGMSRSLSNGDVLRLNVNVLVNDTDLDRLQGRTPDPAPQEELQRIPIFPVPLAPPPVEEGPPITVGQYGRLFDMEDADGGPREAGAAEGDVHLRPELGGDGPGPGEDDPGRGGQDGGGGPAEG